MPHMNRRRSFSACDLAYLNTSASGWALELVPAETPVITHVHELGLQLDVIERADRESLMQLLSRTARYVAVSAQVAAELRSRYNIGEHSIEVHRGFVPLTNEPTRAELVAARETLGVPAGTPIVGCVGAVEWRKGADLFVQLAQRILSRQDGGSDAVLVWVGAPNDHFWERAIAHDVAHLGLGGRVRFVGGVQDPRPLMRLMDVFVLPSRSDPFPLSCLEAAALGTPLVCFDAGGMTEFLEPRERLVVPYLDLDAMADRVVELLMAPAERRLLGEKLAQRVRERNDIALAAPALLRTIERLMR